MKKLFSVTLLLLLFIGVSYSQEKNAAKLQNEANAALKSKDYKTALKLYEEVISAWGDGEKDGAVVYNAATCAYRTKDFPKALKLYNQASELKYRPDGCCFYIAKVYKLTKKKEEYKKQLLKGISEYPKSKYSNAMKKSVSTIYVKEANKSYVNAQEILNTRTENNRDKWDSIKAKAKVKIDEAVKVAEKALEYYPKNAAAKQIVTNSAELLKS